VFCFSGGGAPDISSSSSFRLSITPVCWKRSNIDDGKVNKRLTGTYHQRRTTYPTQLPSMPSTTSSQACRKQDIPLPMSTVKNHDIVGISICHVSSSECTASRGTYPHASITIGILPPVLPLVSRLRLRDIDRFSLRNVVRPLTPISPLSSCVDLSGLRKCYLAWTNDSKGDRNGFALRRVGRRDGSGRMYKERS
jgi:hypothetical protein